MRGKESDEEGGKIGERIKRFENGEEGVREFLLRRRGVGGQGCRGQRRRRVAMGTH